VLNAGPAPAVNTTVVDPLPAETVFVSCQTTLGTCSGPTPGTTGTVTADLGTLPAGSGAVVRIRVVLSGGAAGSVNNTATVTTSTPDSNPNNNSDAVVVVSGAPIPTLSYPMLGLLALALAALGATVLRRSPGA
jgi:hypothetical protein